ncbi:MAG TPA: hypothetical protein VKB26_12440, partial [Candidatus Acidoferrales bacterium]|nr:hypothetical protein [Candidatus Acidoferrales bacterium]
MKFYAKSFHLAIAVAVILMLAALPLHAQGQASAPLSKSGKKLFGTSEALRVARVSSPRISPDGSTVAYLVSSVKMEKDDPGKS